MRLLRIERFGFVLNLTLALALPAVAPVSLPAQPRFIVKTAFCAGGAILGAKLGGKLAEIEARKLKLGAAEARQHARAFQIGTALALCGGGVLVANTVYGKLSKRDMEARQKEMDAALLDAAPGTRTYVLPDSRQAGKIETTEIVLEDKKECRLTVDNLAESGEPAMAKFCRKPPNGKFEVEY